MSDQAVVAGSFPADPFNGENVSLQEFNQFRTNGELPERFKPQDAPEQTEEAAGEEPESDSDSEPEQPQEQPQKGSAAEKRIKQLLAKTKELERQLAAKPPTPTDSSPKQPAQNYEEWNATFDAKQWRAEYIAKHPEAEYEDVIDAQIEFKAQARDHFRGIEERVKAERQALDSKVGEAREKYENFDEIKEAFLGKVIGEKSTPLIPLTVLNLINDSDYLADVVYTIGSDPDELAKFVAMAKTSPNQAIRYVTKVESLIAEELSKPSEKPRGEDGKFTAPAKPTTKAPKPPSPVSGPSSGAFDVSDDSLSNEEWMRKRNAQVAARR